MSPQPPADCVFCGIVARTVPAHTILEDEGTLAFLDLNPATEGHTLVVPRQHADDLLTVDADTAAAVMRTATRVARLLDERLAPDGLTLFQANRTAGWQDVFHLHLHLVPRWEGDDLTRPWTSRPGDPAALAATAARLRG
jgi:histidine triad (HIT) family protein